MANIQAIELAYSTFEPMDGADMDLSPVVFCHGAAACKENWGDIPQKVADATKRKTYSLDARNHGDSVWSDDFNFDIVADDLLHFLETNDISKAVLVGHSMGGITVFKTALKRPEIVEKLVVEDIYTKKIPKSILDGCISYFNLAQNAIQEAPEDLNEDDLKKFVMDYIHSRLPQEVQDLRRGDRETEAGHMANFKRDEEGRWIFKTNLAVIEKAMNDEETIMSESEGLYDGPTCFICGKLSPINVLEEEENIKQLFPNAIFELIDDATHTVHADHPIEFTDALLKFIT